MPSMKAIDHKMFGVAHAAARTSTHEKALIGAVVVRGRDILSVGVNGRKSHPLQRYYNAFRFSDERANHLMHAEIDAIVKAKEFLGDDTSIYVYRVLRNGTTAMCRPCVGCLRALKDYGIKRVFYTTGDGLAYEEI